MLDPLLSLLIGGSSGGAIGAIVVWLLRNWITERLKQSIAHEYNEKLENHKAELDRRLQAMRHEYEVNQLRTSLFFDHQRTAFAELLAKIAEINEVWWDEGCQKGIGLTTPVPNKLYQELKHLYYEHQLFLDSECIMGMELVFEQYESSMPFDDGSGNPPVQPDPRAAYDNIDYLNPQLASIFQHKIGVAADNIAVKRIAMLGAIRILNRYHFREVGLPVCGNLKLERHARPAEAVIKAEQYLPELVTRLKEFHDYLNTETFFHEAQASLARYLRVLDVAR